MSGGMHFAARALPKKVDVDAMQAAPGGGINA